MDKRIVKIGSRYTVVTWDARSSQWHCASRGHGYGVGRTPEAAIKGAGLDAGLGPLLYLSKRAAEEASA